MPQAKGEKKTDAERRAQNKYQAKTYKVVGCKLLIDDARAFIEKVKTDPAFIPPGKDEGNVNMALLSFIEEYMKK